MSLFCKKCNNLLIVETTSESFKFKCNKCELYETPTAYDTLRYEDITGDDLIVFKSILLTASDDPVNPKVEKKCKCGYDRVRQVRLGNEMKLINSCIKCKNQWLEGIES